MTKSGTGTWDGDVGRGRGTGTWDGDVGTRGRRDAGTRGGGNAGMTGRGEVKCIKNVTNQQILSQRLE